MYTHYFVHYRSITPLSIQPLTSPLIVPSGKISPSIQHDDTNNTTIHHDDATSFRWPSRALTFVVPLKDPKGPEHI